MGAATGSLAFEAADTGVAGLDSEGAGISAVSICFFSTAGGRSVVLCLPVVHGGMVRNSSKVKTRGLQHFQPGNVLLLSQLLERRGRNL